MKRSFDLINTLRTLALMVFFLHAWLIPGKSFPTLQALYDTPWSFLFYTPGWAGCWIFFILAGYLAGLSFIENRYILTQSGIWSYYKNKLKHVYLPTMVFIFVAAALVYPHFLYEYPQVLWEFLSCTYYGTPGVNGLGATWFVFTLMWFYLLTPIGVFFQRKVAGHEVMVFFCW